MAEEKRPLHDQKDSEEKPAGTPGGSARVDPKTTHLPISQEERAAGYIDAVAKKLPIPTRDSDGDPTNWILDAKNAARKAKTEPSGKDEDEE